VPGGLGSRPAVIGKAEMTGLPEDDMVQQGDPQQISDLPQSFGQQAIFLTGRTFSRGMIMLCGVGNYVEFLRPDAAAPA